MPSKIESSLTPEQFWDFCEAVAKLKGGRKGATLKQIQQLAAEWDIGYISENSAKSFRDSAFADFLAELKADRDFADDIATVAKEGSDLPDATAMVLSKKIFKATLRLGDDIDPGTADAMTKSVERLRTGNRMARRLEADLVAAKKNIEVADVRITQVQQAMRLQQFDAATAVITHAQEIKLILADKSLDSEARTERVRMRLFGAMPADFKPVTTTGAQTE